MPSESAAHCAAHAEYEPTCGECRVTVYRGAVASAATDEVVHEPETEVKLLLCHDGFHRDFWRATCPCGWHGAWRMFASQAREDASDHD